MNLLMFRMMRRVVERKAPERAVLPHGPTPGRAGRIRRLALFALALLLAAGAFWLLGPGPPPAR